MMLFEDLDFNLIKNEFGNWNGNLNDLSEMKIKVKIFT